MRAFGEARRLPSDELARLCIVIEELLANLYDHSGLTEADEVGLALACDPDGISVSITDPGRPFDPRSARPTAESAQRGGGAGIRLVQAWADLISYDSSPNGNRLELLLPHKRDS